MCVDELQIQKLSKKFKFKTKIYQDTILVESGLEEWAITAYEDYVDLKHLNTAGNRKGKLHFHEQRTFKNLHQAFDCIKKHKPQYKKLKNIEHIQKLFSTL